MAGTTEFSLDRLSARAEIQEVMHRWCRAVDRCDWDVVSRLFHADGHDNHGIYKGGVEGLVAWLSERHKSITRSAHFVTNMLIEFIDDDNALVETYSLAVQRYPGDGASHTRSAISGGADVGDQPFDMVITGRYVDHFQRRDGVWKIFNRTVVFDNSILLPVAGNESAQLSADWAVSTRDRSDPLWGLREKVGLTGG